MKNLEVKYSILIVGYSLDEFEGYIRNWLSKGIKVIWFGSEVELEKLDNEFRMYSKAKLLQLYSDRNKKRKCVVVDGDAKESVYDFIQEINNAFNMEQYKIEHANSIQDIIVEAGAGTGKTTVMINRILYLIHMDESLKLSEIAMITFTNEATQNMRHKLQNELMTRYQLTYNRKYFDWIEQLPQMKINTIHSFSKKLVEELGVNAGFSNKITLRSFIYEKQQIIRDILNEIQMEKGGRLQESIGMPVHELEKLIVRYWNQLDNLGYTEEAVQELDWGNAKNRESEVLHNTIKYVLQRVNEYYSELKKKQNSIAIRDIIGELRSLILTSPDRKLQTMSIRFLFVDEFQDTDNTQISMVAWLRNLLELKLFVVGDIKQSIYRFRGATDTAFEKLKEELANVNGTNIIRYELYKNYRTSRDILNNLHPYFERWSRQGSLKYTTPLVPQVVKSGSLIIEQPKNEREQTSCIKTQILRAISEINVIKNSSTDSNAKIMLLTRTNKQILQIVELCKDEGIPCYAKKEGGFYKSDAVRDFYDMICGYLYNSEAKFMYNYLQSSYARTTNISCENLIGLDGNNEKIMEYLNKVGDMKIEKKYLNKFRLEPTISVLRQIIQECKPLDRYIAKQKNEYKQVFKEDELDKRVYIEALQYQNNLEKIMCILRQNFSGDSVSLYDIYRFLKINIETNREEDDVDIEDQIQGECIYCTTVHKAKGLEYEIVIVPFMNKAYRYNVNTELLVENQKVGWSCFLKRKNILHRNDYYDICVKNEDKEVIEEESRLLYVALTRAKCQLVCVVYGNSDKCWANLMKEPK